MQTVAALFVEETGVYSGLEGVDVWGVSRDARKYRGTHPIVGHPPCQRYSRYSAGGPSHHGKHTLGDDDGCFAMALLALRRWGGVLEHPADSHAWRIYGINKPPRAGGWVPAGDSGWTCEVAQSHYGHRAAKRTWLLVHRADGSPPPDLIWGPGRSSLPPQSAESLARRGRGAYTKNNAIERMCRKERLTTPVPFRDLLISIARGAT